MLHGVSHSHDAFVAFIQLAVNSKLLTMAHGPLAWRSSAMTPSDHPAPLVIAAEVSPFANLDKSTVLQECRAFSDANFVKLHPKRCCLQITKLLFFLVQGETLGVNDSTQVFFGVTKLFQSGDGNLRRMVYLFLKEVGSRQQQPVSHAVNRDARVNLRCLLPFSHANAHITLIAHRL